VVSAQKDYVHNYLEKFQNISEITIFQHTNKIINHSRWSRHSLYQFECLCKKAKFYELW